MEDELNPNVESVMRNMNSVTLTGEHVQCLWCGKVARHVITINTAQTNHSAAMESIDGELEDAICSVSNFDPSSDYHIRVCSSEDAPRRLFGWREGKRTDTDTDDAGKVASESGDFSKASGVTVEPQQHVFGTTFSFYSAGRLQVRGCRRAAGHGSLRAIRHKSTQSALTLAKHLRDVQDEVQLERVSLTTVDQCATAYRAELTLSLLHIYGIMHQHTDSNQSHSPTSQHRIRFQPGTDSPHQNTFGPMEPVTAGRLNTNSSRWHFSPHDEELAPEIPLSSRGNVSAAFLPLNMEMKIKRSHHDAPYPTISMFHIQHKLQYTTLACERMPCVAQEKIGMYPQMARFYGNEWGKLGESNVKNNFHSHTFIRASLAAELGRDYLTTYEQSCQGETCLIDRARECLSQHGVKFDFLRVRYASLRPVIAAA
ncbi:hypothetical protein JOB18_041433 [Solea senegalensis]|uniref:Uncharacterized protein n=1 Tax=Solea senegalensis TaxID=28829 RepID=A0AAV6T1H1_SOLSE|nr:hypothetical protein JOB18_041433 [Solea senegalensis]